MINNTEDQNKDIEKEQGQGQVKENDGGTQHMATNPNPRANENIKDVPFDKDESSSEVGSEITDGEGG